MIADEPVATPDRMTHVGRYRLISKLGRGATSQVYLALDEQGESVTVKLLPHAAVSETAMQRFRSEAAILADLDHPGLPRLIDSAETEGLPIDIPYIVTQYIHGLSLGEHAACHQLDDAMRLKIIADICQPLQYLHDKGILHRDIKPSNIIMTPDARPVIIDFGHAAPIQRANNNTNNTDPHRGIGTTRYASPEAISASTTEGPPTDVYALAVVCFELLTNGDWPYAVESASLDECQTIESVLPTRLSASRPELCGPLDEILSQALAKDPSRRYASPSAFADDLRSYLQGRPVRARAIGKRETFIHCLKHSRQAATIIALLVCFSLVAAVGWFSAHARLMNLHDTQKRVGIILISSDMDSPAGRATIAKEIADWDSQLVWSVLDAMSIKAMHEGRYAESISWLHQAREWVVRVYAEDHQFVLRAEQVLCETMINGGHAEEAGRRLRTIISQSVSSPSDTVQLEKVKRNRLLRLYWTLGVCLESQGHLEEARTLLAEVYKVQADVLDPDHTDKPDTLATLQRVEKILVDR